MPVRHAMTHPTDTRPDGEPKIVIVGEHDEMDPQYCEDMGCFDNVADAASDKAQWLADNPDAVIE